MKLNKCMMMHILSCYHCERLSEIPILTKLNTEKTKILNSSGQQEKEAELYEIKILKRRGGTTLNFFPRGQKCDRKLGKLMRIKEN